LGGNYTTLWQRWQCLWCCPWLIIILYQLEYDSSTQVFLHSFIHFLVVLDHLERFVLGWCFRWTFCCWRWQNEEGVHMGMIKTRSSQNCTYFWLTCNIQSRGIRITLEMLGQTCHPLWTGIKVHD
jgi:hypothetical protein